MTQRAQRIGGRIVLLFGGILVGVLLAEAGLRVLGISYPRMYVPDRNFGVKLQPGFQGRWSKEGGAAFRVNSAGFRDRPRSKTPPPGTLRIAVLGDSFIEALQVPFEQSFSAVLQRELNERLTPPRQAEVLSFGVSGLGTAQELLLLRHEVWDYQPDVVLLAFYPGNDVADNSPKLAANRVKPFFRLEDGELVLDDSFRCHPDFVKAQSAWTKFKVGLINRSRVLQLLVETRDALAAAEGGQRSSATEPGEPAVGDLCFVPPHDPAWVEAWQVTERLVTQMHAESQARGAQFVLAVLSVDRQVHPDAEKRAALRERLGVDDLFYCERRLQELGRREGFPVIALGQPMQQHARRRGVFLHGFANTAPGEGHWNARGHRLAAELVAEALLAKNALRAAALSRRRKASE